MPTRDIPRSEWEMFFNTFSGEHEGWLTTVEVSDADNRTGRIEAVEMPLEGISADLKDRENRISISLGREPNDFVSHEVPAPQRVQLEQTEQGADKGLRIESQDGSTTIVRFRATTLPESLDGLPG